MKLFKYTISLLMGVVLAQLAKGQDKTESVHIDWPNEYKWKIVHESEDSLSRKMIMIPGKEDINTATIIGCITAYKGVKYENNDSLIDYYKLAIDTGTTFTLLEQSSKSERKWIMFKVETPITEKYAIAESDLYFVLQGDFALYEIYVGIKSSTLNPAFISRWSKILKKSQLAIDYK